MMRAFKPEAAAEPPNTQMNAEKTKLYCKNKYQLFWLKRKFIQACIVSMLFLTGANQVIGADFSLKPTLSISEEFTDNVFETRLNQRSEFITRAMPGLSINYKAPFWTWDSTYTFEYRNYARKSKGDEYNHNAAVKGLIVPVENFMFIDLSDTYRRVSLDVSRNADTESSLFLNQTDQNIATVSPYLLWRMRGDNTLKTGYRFTDTRYWDQIGIEKQEHKGFADLTHNISSRFSLSTGYSFTRLESLPSRFNKHDIYGGFKYEYAEKSFISGQVGNSWQQFDSGIKVNYLFWNAGITHDFNFAVATFETKVSTTEDPLAVSTRETSYSGKLEKALKRGLIGLSASYSEYDNTATNSMNRHKLALSAYGRYEVMQDLTANLSATGERFSSLTTTEFPYRLTGVAGLSYALKNELTIGLVYTHVNNQMNLDKSADAYQVNKVVLEVRKTF